MLKAVFLLPRRLDLTHEQFMRRLESHVPLLRAVPGVQRFEWAEAVAAPDGRPPYDAIIELWFDELDDVRAAIVSDEAKRAEENLVGFVDFGGYQLFLTVERDT